MAKEQLHEDRSGQPTPPNIRVLTIVLDEFDGKSQDRYAKQILKLFLLSGFTANLAGHLSSSLSHEIAGQATVSELCGELAATGNQFHRQTQLNRKMPTSFCNI